MTVISTALFSWVSIPSKRKVEPARVLQYETQCSGVLWTYQLGTMAGIRLRASSNVFSSEVDSRRAPTRRSVFGVMAGIYTGVLTEDV